MITAWLAGIGRYWDHPNAELWQYLGLSSVSYIFIFAFIIWIIINPLKPDHWDYKSVLIFVGMTSPPALFYAIPVERFFSLSTAQTMNVWFLSVVAVWRVALFAMFLLRSARLNAPEVVVATMLPIALIICTLAMLNLEYVVFDIMTGSGVSISEDAPNDAEYGILWGITRISFWSLPVLLFLFVKQISKKTDRKRNTKITSSIYYINNFSYFPAL